MNYIQIHNVDTANLVYGLLILFCFFDFIISRVCTFANGFPMCMAKLTSDLQLRILDRDHFIQILLF